MSASPYIVSNWVKDDQFFGREDLCRALAGSPERCIYLAGTRRIGKTSLLMRLAAQLHPHALYCDLMRAGGSEGLDEARLVALMRRQLGALAAHSAPLAESRAVWDREAGSLCAWLEEASWRWEDLGLTVTLLWDEAELLRRMPNATLMPLRAILQHSGSLRAIICASKGLADLNDRWRDEHVSPFLFGFKTEYIADLTDAEADELIRQRGRVQVTDAAAATIRAWTGNHPFLIQSLCSRLYDGGRLRDPSAGDLVVDAMLADLFRIDIGALAPGEQALLAALAGGPLSYADLRERAGLPDEAARSFADGLIQLGMLRADEDGRWRVGNEFLAQWLRGRPAPAAAISDRASLEVADQEIQRLALERAQERHLARNRPGRADADNSPSRIAALDRKIAERASQIAPGAGPLSERERAVLRLVAAGRSNAEIAGELVIALDTVKTHLKHISSKLGASNRAQAVARAKELGVI